MKNEQYLNIIQNLVNTNTKENLQERWLKIVREFEDYNITFIQNTAKIFLMDLVNLQNDIKRQDYSKQDVFEIAPSIIPICPSKHSLHSD